MKKIYDKNELNFALIWIAIYVVLVSVCDNISGSIGIVKIVTAPVCIALTLIMYLWIRKNGLKEKYGLCSFEGSANRGVEYIALRGIRGCK